MVLVNEAWAILSAPESRKLYDDARVSHVNHTTDGPHNSSSHQAEDDLRTPNGTHTPNETAQPNDNYTRQHPRQYRRGWGWEDEVEEPIRQSPTSQTPQQSRPTYDVSGTRIPENNQSRKNDSASLTLYITILTVLGLPVVLLIAAYAEFNLYCAAIPIVLGLIVVRHIAVLISGHDDSKYWENS